MSKIDSSSSSSKQRNFVDISSDISNPPQLDDAVALDDLWNSLRLEKELKMNKERPKVKSLEDYKPPAAINNVLRTPSPRPASGSGLKISTLFRPSPNGRDQIVIFDLRGVERDDIRVTFRRDHIMVSWEKWEVENWEEEDCIARRTVERVYHRVIPLAEGTTVGG
ncbi:hypothetical protein B0H17DRAFT_917887 [Mycena rosella]|uniref:SHSP domain-containing protein n=1 Tax=Mycena rosella TaxID=1033263 RepID=A0AAD7GXT7_MYCRO|nr:hypothetical protein B0H17DRAFT_917887 [Mycena rosella]